jgi:serum/glucocorticoid-regulated kinase 2
LEPFYCSGIHGSSEKIQLKDFIFIKNIGIGGFSLVYLVKKKDTGKFYAMKLIDKDFIIKVYF